MAGSVIDSKRFLCWNVSLCKFLGYFIGSRYCLAYMLSVPL